VDEPAQWQGNLAVFVHELNHVALGPTSVDQEPKDGPTGWCRGEIGACASGPASRTMR
jgi:hypothetical protein